MNLRQTITAVAAMSLIFGGCTGPTPTTIPVLKVSKSAVNVTPEVKSAIDAIGGFDAWTKINEIQASLDLAVYGAGGQKFVNRFQLKVDLDDSRLTAVTDTSAGTWTVSITQSGGTIAGRGFTAGEDVKKITLNCFMALMHDIIGPLNLVYGEQAGLAQQVKVGGIRLIRIPVIGGPSRAAAYYFDPVSYVLFWQTSGADEPGQNGTLSVYNYKMLSNGMLFPSSIKSIKLGQYTLMGKEPVWDAELTDVVLSK